MSAEVEARLEVLREHLRAGTKVTTGANGRVSAFKALELLDSVVVAMADASDHPAECLMSWEVRPFAAEVVGDRVRVDMSVKLQPGAAASMSDRYLVMKLGRSA